MIYSEKCVEAGAEADKFGRGLPAQVVEYHSCGDWLNHDKVVLERSYAIVHQHRYMVAITLRKEKIADGICIKGQVCLEKYFATLDDARSFAKWCTARRGAIYFMNDGGRGSFPRYASLSARAFWDKDDASHNYRFDWKEFLLNERIKI